MFTLTAMWQALSFASPLNAAGVDETALKKRYDALISFQADILQTKTAPYLIRPLISKVRLDVSRERILWQILEPKPLTVKIAGDTLTFLDETGKPHVGMHTVDPQKKEFFVKVLGALFTGDITKLKTIFTVDTSGDRMTLTARDADNLLRKVTFWFTPELTPRRMELVLGQETLLFEFSHCTIN